jgi:PKHD-type hydroxylase
MQYPIVPYARTTEPYVWWKGGFSENEIDWLAQKALVANERAQAGGQTEDTLLNVRRSYVNWLECDNESKWVYEKLENIVSSLNAQYYGFDLTCFAEALQLTRYCMSEQGMYGWHQDCGEGGKPNRKLSLVMQLTDPSQYEGGNLEIMTNKDPLVVPKEKGLVTVFPSYMLHQVTPVVQGERASLVTWISGPTFK